MLDHELVLESCPKNVQKLHSSIDFKFYQAILYFEKDDHQKLHPLLQEISKKSEIFIIRRLNNLNPIIGLYIQALLFWNRHPDKTQEIISKWALLQNQDIFYRPYLQIGSCYERMKAFDKADDYYNRCIEKFKQNSTAYYFLGKLEIQRDNVEYAITLLKKGLEYNESHTAILETLARHYEGQGRLRAAMRYYQKLLDQQPANQRLINKISEIVELSHAAITQSSNSYPQKIKHKQEPAPKKQIIQQKAEKKPQRKQKLNFNPYELNVKMAKIKSKEDESSSPYQRKQIKAKQEQELPKPKPKEEEEPIRPKQTKLDINPRQEQPKPPQVNAVDSLSAVEKAAYRRLLAQISDNPSNSDAYLAIIQFCQQRGLQEQCFAHLEELVRNDKRSAPLINRICKQIEQLFLRVPSSYRRVIHLLSQLHKKSVFVHLYLTLLSVLHQDRERAIQASQALNLSLFVDETMLSEERRELFENYAFLMGKLIDCEKIDLLSLSDLYKRMISFFERSLNKQDLNVSELLKEKVFLKNLLVSAKQFEVTVIVFLQDIDSIIEYSKDIFTKEETAFIICDEASLRKSLKSYSTIIILPQSLTLIGECIHSIRKRFAVLVIQPHESNPEDAAFIQKECNDLKGRNGRISLVPNLPLALINQQLINTHQQ